jgi:beta-galactosidase
MRIFSSLLPFLLFIFSIFLSSSSNGTGRIGAQVWIEKGMSQTEIDGYFAALDRHHMHVARLFMMWNFMETAPNQWDFSEFDWAFEAAEKHKVKIVATLMPNFGPTHRGFYYKTQDGAIAKSWRQWEESKNYIQTVVKRYASHPALGEWMLMNEPGQMPSPDSLAMDRFKSFLTKKYGSIDKLNAAWLTGFSDFQNVTYSPSWAGGGFTWPVSYLDWQNFWAEHLTWYLAQVAGEIRKTDPKTPLHVNPHALLDIPHRYELKKWAGFLESLGSSIHPVWHFNDLKRPEYPLGIEFVADMVGNAAVEKPFWVTELQGGHNIYTGSQPINPTENEMKSWLWSSVLSGAEKTIFWCLNPRTQGGESGEWALLDYQSQASHRLKIADSIASKVEKWSAFFEKAKPVFDQISLVISPETMFLQERNGKGQGQVSRQQKAHFQSVLGCYNALRMKGFHPRIVFMDDKDWFAKSATKELAIVCHATALKESQLENLKAFAERGNTILFTGMVGIFNELEKTRWLGKNLISDLAGAAPLEVMTAENPHQIGLPFETFWVKTSVHSAQKSANGLLENGIGNGKVIWMPALADLFHYLHPEEKSYPDFLEKICKPFQNPNSSRFESKVPGSFCQSLQADNQFITMAFVPLTKVRVEVKLQVKGSKMKEVLSGKAVEKKLPDPSFSISSGQTFVVASEL